MPELYKSELLPMDELVYFRSPYINELVLRLNDPKNHDKFLLCEVGWFLVEQSDFTWRPAVARLMHAAVLQTILSLDTPLPWETVTTESGVDQKLDKLNTKNDMACKTESCVRVSSSLVTEDTDGDMCKCFGVGRHCEWFAWTHSQPLPKSFSTHRYNPNSTSKSYASLDVLDVNTSAQSLITNNTWLNIYQHSPESFTSSHLQHLFGSHSSTGALDLNDASTQKNLLYSPWWLGTSSWVRQWCYDSEELLYFNMPGSNVEGSPDISTPDVTDYVTDYSGFSSILNRDSNAFEIDEVGVGEQVDEVGVDVGERVDDIQRNVDVRVYHLESSTNTDEETARLMRNTSFLKSKVKDLFQMSSSCSIHEPYNACAAIPPHILYYYYSAFKYSDNKKKEKKDVSGKEGREGREGRDKKRRKEKDIRLENNRQITVETDINVITKDMKDSSKQTSISSTPNNDNYTDSNIANTTDNQDGKLRDADMSVDTSVPPVSSSIPLSPPSTSSSTTAPQYHNCSFGCRPPPSSLLCYCNDSVMWRLGELLQQMGNVCVQYDRVEEDALETAYIESLMMDDRSSVHSTLSQCSGQYSQGLSRDSLGHSKDYEHGEYFPEYEDGQEVDPTVIAERQRERERAKERERERRKQIMRRNKVVKHKFGGMQSLLGDQEVVNPINGMFYHASRVFGYLQKLGPYIGVFGDDFSYGSDSAVNTQSLNIELYSSVMRKLGRGKKEGEDESRSAFANVFEAFDDDEVEREKEKRKREKDNELKQHSHSLHTLNDNPRESSSEDHTPTAHSSRQSTPTDTLVSENVSKKEGSFPASFSSFFVQKTEHCYHGASCTLRLSRWASMLLLWSEWQYVAVEEEMCRPPGCVGAQAHVAAGDVGENLVKACKLFEIALTPLLLLYYGGGGSESGEKENGVMLPEPDCCSGICGAEKANISQTDDSPDNGSPLSISTPQLFHPRYSMYGSGPDEHIHDGIVEWLNARWCMSGYHTHNMPTNLGYTSNPEEGEGEDGGESSQLIYGCFNVGVGATAVFTQSYDEVRNVSATDISNEKEESTNEHGNGSSSVPSSENICSIISTHGNGLSKTVSLLLDSVIVIVDKQMEMYGENDDVPLYSLPNNIMQIEQQQVSVEETRGSRGPGKAVVVRKVPDYGWNMFNFCNYKGGYSEEKEGGKVVSKDSKSPKEGKGKVSKENKGVSKERKEKKKEKKFSVGSSVNTLLCSVVRSAVDQVRCRLSHGNRRHLSLPTESSIEEECDSITLNDSTHSSATQPASASHTSSNAIALSVSCMSTLSSESGCENLHHSQSNFHDLEIMSELVSAPTHWWSYLHPNSSFSTSPLHTTSTHSSPNSQSLNINTNSQSTSTDNLSSYSKLDFIPVCHSPACWSTSTLSHLTMTYSNTIGRYLGLLTICPAASLTSLFTSKTQISSFSPDAIIYMFLCVARKLLLVKNISTSVLQSVTNLCFTANNLTYSHYIDYWLQDVEQLCGAYTVARDVHRERWREFDLAIQRYRDKREKKEKKDTVKEGSLVTTTSSNLASDFALCLNSNSDHVPAERCGEKCLLLCGNRDGSEPLSVLSVLLTQLTTSSSYIYNIIHMDSLRYLEEVDLVDSSSYSLTDHSTSPNNTLNNSLSPSGKKSKKSSNDAKSSTKQPTSKKSGKSKGSQSKTVESGKLDGVGEEHSTIVPPVKKFTKLKYLPVSLPPHWTFFADLHVSATHNTVLYKQLYSDILIHTKTRVEYMLEQLHLNVDSVVGVFEVEYSNHLKHTLNQIARKVETIRDAWRYVYRTAYHTNDKPRKNNKYVRNGVLLRDISFSPSKVVNQHVIDVVVGVVMGADGSGEEGVVHRNDEENDDEDDGDTTVCTVLADILNKAGYLAPSILLSSSPSPSFSSCPSFSPSASSSVIHSAESVMCVPVVTMINIFKQYITILEHEHAYYLDSLSTGQHTIHAILTHYNAFANALYFATGYKLPSVSYVFFRNKPYRDGYSNPYLTRLYTHNAKLRSMLNHANGVVLEHTFLQMTQNSMYKNGIANSKDDSLVLSDPQDFLMNWKSIGHGAFGVVYSAELRDDYVLVEEGWQGDRRFKRVNEREVSMDLDSINGGVTKDNVRERVKEKDKKRGEREMVRTDKGENIHDMFTLRRDNLHNSTIPDFLMERRDNSGVKSRHTRHQSSFLLEHLVDRADGVGGGDGGDPDSLSIASDGYNGYNRYNSNGLGSGRYSESEMSESESESDDGVLYNPFCTSFSPSPSPSALGKKKTRSRQRDSLHMDSIEGKGVNGSSIVRTQSFDMHDIVKEVAKTHEGLRQMGEDGNKVYRNSEQNIVIPENIINTAKETNPTETNPTETLDDLTTQYNTQLNTTQYTTECNETPTVPVYSRHSSLPLPDSIPNTESSPDPVSTTNSPIIPHTPPYPNTSLTSPSKSASSLHSLPSRSPHTPQKTSSRFNPVGGSGVANSGFVKSNRNPYRNPNNPSELNKPSNRTGGRTKPSNRTGARTGVLPLKALGVAGTVGLSIVESSEDEEDFEDPDELISEGDEGGGVRGSVKLAKTGEVDNVDGETAKYNLASEAEDVQTKVESGPLGPLPNVNSNEPRPDMVVAVDSLYEATVNVTENTHTSASSEKKGWWGGMWANIFQSNSPQVKKNKKNRNDVNFTGDFATTPQDSTISTQGVFPSVPLSGNQLNHQLNQPLPNPMLPSGVIQPPNLGVMDRSRRSKHPTRLNGDMGVGVGRRPQTAQRTPRKNPFKKPQDVYDNPLEAPVLSLSKSDGGVADPYKEHVNHASQSKRRENNSKDSSKTQVYSSKALQVLRVDQQQQLLLHLHNNNKFNHIKLYNHDRSGLNTSPFKRMLDKHQHQYQHQPHFLSSTTLTPSLALSTVSSSTRTNTRTNTSTDKYYNFRSPMLAIKQISLINSDGQQAGIKETLNLASYGYHPNIVKFYGSYVTENNMWILMRLCDGGTLAQLVAKNDLEESCIAYIVSEVIKGLIFLHSQHKIHRDIKPNNIFLNLDGTVVIGDLGLCVDSDTNIKTSLAGTEYYLSPEMVSGQGYNTKTDIWSVGCLILEICNGAPPYKYTSTLTCVYRLGVLDPPQLKHKHKWSPLLIDFVNKCLMKDPAQRLSALQLLQHDFMAQACDKTQLAELFTHVFADNALKEAGLL